MVWIAILGGRVRTQWVIEQHQATNKQLNTSNGVGTPQYPVRPTLRIGRGWLDLIFSIFTLTTIAEQLFYLRVARFSV